MQAHEQSLLDRIQHVEYLFKDKERAFNKVEAMYKKLKGQQLASGIEQAADHDADQVLQGDTQHHSSQVPVLGRRQHRNGSNGSWDSDERRRRAFNPNSQLVPQGLSSRVHRAMGSSRTLQATFHDNKRTDHR